MVTLSELLTDVRRKAIASLAFAGRVDGIMLAPIAFDEMSSDKSFDDAAALDWLRAQPGGRITACAAGLGREWGWNRMRAGRRLKAWAVAGYINISRSGNTITITALSDPTGVAAAVTNVTDAVTDVTAAVTNVTVGVKEGVTRGDTNRVTARPAAMYDSTPAQHWTVIRVCTLVAALALAAVSGVIAVEGLTMVFAGAFWPVVAIGATLEASKLVATAWLRENWCVAERILRAVLLAMILILIALNGVGVFGFLTRAHLEHQVVMEAETADRAADVKARLTVEEGALDDLDTRIKQIDAAIDESTRRGRPAVAMAVGNSLHRTRNQLSVNRQQETVALAGLQVEESQIEAQLKRARSEVGPVRYLAELLGGSSVDLERAVRILTLAVVGVLDPLAITLLVAAASQPWIRARVARKIQPA
jgi:hypothetical protein